MRLIDLFHITGDRTPYALWRFVSPTDHRSEEEWKKHRALHAVVPLPFPPGRAIKVQGFTEDEEVWAGLQDLRRYCDDQVTRTLDLCARHVPRRYMLDFVKLDWAVPTGDLRPVDLAFGFDSKAVFRILSEDIYDSDKYVFLRELLQNAIDAIRMRRARHNQRDRSNSRRKQSGPSFDTTIYFTVVHQENGDVVVTCRDYGVGMDEHVIRNYFTVAGASYYRSEAFKRQHLGFEPVSRFGIGILSCFMVADSIDVKTFRDPECGPAMTYADSQLPSFDEHRARPLHLRVPAVDRQFVVKDLRGNIEVGTEVTLKVQKKKAKPTDSTTKRHDNADSDGGGFRRTLEIAEYLCEIAGFVEFPILVKESWPELDKPQLTLILHPDGDPIKEAESFRDAVSVHQLSKDYPWEHITATESLSTVRQVMSEHKIELGDILGNVGYEGWIVYPTPNGPDSDFATVAWNKPVFHHSGNQLFLRDRRDLDKNLPSVYWREDIQDRYDRKQRNKILFGVYRDGILIANLNSSSKLEGGGELPEPLVRVNLSTETSPLPTVSRANLHQTKTKWDTPIWDAVKSHLVEQNMSDLLSLKPAERMYRVGWLAEVFGLPYDIDRQIPAEKRVSLWLNDSGEVVVQEGEFRQGDILTVVPEEFKTYSRELVARFFDLPIKSEARHSWRGPKSLLMDLMDYSPLGRSLGGPLSRGIAICEHRGGKPLHHVGLRFLEPPPGFSTPIGLPIYEVGTSDLSEDDDEEKYYSPYKERRELLNRTEIVESLRIAFSSPESLDGQQLDHVRRAVWANAFVPVSFAEPFSEKFMANPTHVNFLHPVGKIVLRCLAVCALAELDNRLPQSARSQLVEIASQLSDRGWVVVSGWRTTGGNLAEVTNSRECIAHLLRIVEQHQLIDGFVAPEIPSWDEWVPTMENKPPSDLRTAREYIDVTELTQPFGKLISEWPPANVDQPRSES